MIMKLRFRNPCIRVLLLDPGDSRIESLPVVLPLQGEDPREVEIFRLVVDLVDAAKPKVGTNDHRAFADRRPEKMSLTRRNS